ncbi:DUF6660 family protein [Mucilaginibacter puniceus]
MGMLQFLKLLRSFDAMRLFSLIMCIIVLSLGLMPCKDSNAVAKSYTKYAVEAAHHGSNPVQDACSPFCHCSCCNTPSLTAIRPLLFSIPLEVDNSYPELQTSKIKNRNLVIWQPPKLIA